MTPYTPDANRFPTVPNIAYFFCEALTRKIGLKGIEEVNRRNLEASEDLACASHDFCDANEMMIDALRCVAVNFNPADSEQAQLTDRAWQVARHAGFDAQRVGVAFEALQAESGAAREQRLAAPRGY